MRNYQWICLLAALYLTQSFTCSEQDPAFIKSFATDGPILLKLATSGGSIEVASTEQSDVVLEFHIRKNGRAVDLTLDELRNYKVVQINQTDNEISVAVKNHDDDRGKSYSVSFVAHVPQRTSIHLSTSGGRIEVEGLHGNQQMRTSGGGLRARSIVGHVSGGTSGGSIGVKDIQGNVELGTSGGSIKVIEVDGNALVNTTGGSITLKHITGAAEARTSGGSITGEFTELGGNINLSTSGGSIHLDVPDESAIEIDLHGSHVTMDLDNFSGEMKRNWANGSINGGGIRVACHTSGGSVHLH